MEEKRVTVRKLDHAGREMTAYPGRIVRQAEGVVVLATRWKGPRVDLGYVTLEPGDRWLETFWTERWYNVFEIHAADGRLKGWYWNVARPARVSDGEVVWEDLALDVWVDPAGQALVLDEEEFAGLGLSPQEGASARAALSAILKTIAPETVRRAVGERDERTTGD
jgi:predicted RNA-binding protein associated with RNAse of E/G family